MPFQIRSISCVFHPLEIWHPKAKSKPPLKSCGYRSKAAQTDHKPSLICSVPQAELNILDEDQIFWMGMIQIGYVPIETIHQETENL